MQLIYQPVTVHRDTDKAMNTLLSLTNEGVCHHKCSPHEVRRDGQANSEVSPGDLICSRSGVEYGLHHLSHSLEK